MEALGLHRGRFDALPPVPGESVGRLEDLRDIGGRQAGAPEDGTTVTETAQHRERSGGALQPRGLAAVRLRLLVGYRRRKMLSQGHPWDRPLPDAPQACGIRNQQIAEQRSRVSLQLADARELVPPPRVEPGLRHDEARAGFELAGEPGVLPDLLGFDGLERGNSATEIEGVPGETGLPGSDEHQKLQAVEVEEGPLAGAASRRAAGFPAPAPGCPRRLRRGADGREGRCRPGRPAGATRRVRSSSRRRGGWPRGAAGAECRP